MSYFDEAVKHILDVEGGYVDDPSDSGGATMHGVTERVARAHGYKGPMKDLSKSKAIEIAKMSYWDTLELDTIAAYGYPLALVMLVAGYHAGPGMPARWLQISLNAANNEGKSWPDIKEDGEIGPGTLSALQAMFTRRGEEGMTILRRSVNAFYGVFLTNLTRSRQKDEKFWYGWFKQRVL